MKCRAVRDGDDWVLDGVKRWITNAGVSEYYTVMTVSDPDSGARGISAFRGREIRRSVPDAWRHGAPRSDTSPSGELPSQACSAWSLRPCL